MKQKLKILIIALAIALFFGGYNISAITVPVYTFDDFLIEIANNNFDIRFAAPIYQWNQNLTINNNGTIRGGLGSAFVILDGDNLHRAFSIDGKTIDFYDNFEFKNFYADNINGVIYANNANINFTSSAVNFSNNTAQNGGAIYAYNANINFTSSAVNFSNNTAQNGGAIYAYSTNINFTSSVSVVNFSNNTAGYGGAIFLTRGINFTNSIVNFISNSANRDGGAIVGYGYIISTNSVVNFTGNTALDNGGAIFLGVTIRIHFTSSVVNFTSNTAGQYGGAISMPVNNSNVNFTNSEVNFTSNTAGQYGGAIYIYMFAITQNTNVNFTFTNSEVNFISNIAIQDGDAIFINTSSISFISSNLAAMQAERNAYKIVFFGNMAGGKPNDIYMESAQLWIKDSVWMEGGIKAVYGSTIAIYGGIWHLGGLNEFSEMGLFEIKTSSLMIVDSTFSYINGEAINVSDAYLSFSGTFSSTAFIGNGGADAWDIVLMNSHLNLDPAARNGRVIFTDGLRVVGGQITKIGAGIAEFNGDIHLDTKFVVEAGTALFKSKTVHISTVDIKADAALSFKGNGFGHMYVWDILIGGIWEIDVDFSSQTLDSDKIISSGTISISNGSSLIINPLSLTTWLPSGASVTIASGTIAYLDYGFNYDRSLYTVSYKPDRVILINKAYHPAIHHAPAPSDLANDRFLAHIITRVAADNSGLSIYPHIKLNLISWLKNNMQDDERLYFHSLWIETFARESVIDERLKNNFRFFRESGYGARIGINIIEDEFKVFGVFGSMEKMRMKQWRNSANIDAFEAGGYGGIFSGIFKHKFFISAAVHDVETERFAAFQDDYFRPKTLFHLMSLKWGFESSMEMPPYFQQAKTSLFAGAYEALVFNREISEWGGGISNMTIEADRYWRTAVYGGIRLEKSFCLVCGWADKLFF